MILRLGCFGLILLICMGGFIASTPANAQKGQPDGAPEPEVIGKNYDSEGEVPAMLPAGFAYRLNALAYTSKQQPADSTQNPGNDFLLLPAQLSSIALRPDFQWDLAPLVAAIRPRLTIDHLQWEEGLQNGDTTWEEDLYVNEFLLRLSVGESLFISYGRENLQWGPSFLLSPSNPFFVDNGKSRPRLEVPGKGFARLVWVGQGPFSLSLIANTDAGHAREERFKATQAVKFDYAGQQGYGSLVLSHRQGEDLRLGGFAGVTASDALLLYGEAGCGQGSAARYPVDAGPPFYGRLQKNREESSQIMGILLVGGAYTFSWGDTLTVEYLFNQAGYDHREAADYFRLRKRAKDAFYGTGPLHGLAQQVLGEAVDTGLLFLRQNYAMGQYMRDDIFDRMDMTLRWTQCLDDGSARGVAMLDFDWGDYLEPFFSGHMDLGGPETAFGNTLDYRATVGLEITY